MPAGPQALSRGFRGDQACSCASVAAASLTAAANYRHVGGCGGVSTAPFAVIRQPTTARRGPRISYVSRGLFA